MSDVGQKRAAADAASSSSSSDSSDEDIGPPMPGPADAESEDEFVGPPIPANEAEAPTKRKKKRKVLVHETLFLENLPQSEQYESSYTHREPISHVVVTKTDFVISASRDGMLMFWKKKNEGGIEFVKTFKSHLGDITGMAADLDGAFLATTSDDKSLKIYNVLAFDMINMMKLPFVPGVCEWVHARAAAVSRVAVADSVSSAIYIYDGRGTNAPLHVLTTHVAPVTSIQYNPISKVAISADEKGMIEYWDCEEGYDAYEFPTKKVSFEFPSDTDLFDFVKQKPKAIPWGLSISPDGKKFASMASDRKVRLFSFTTGKLLRVYDESETAQETGGQFDIMELKRNMAGERDLMKSAAIRQEKTVFDETSNFLLYPTMVGIKMVNVHTNKCVKVLGKSENMRFLGVSLYQGYAKDEINEASTTLEMEAADNPGLQVDLRDPTVFVTSYKKQRFYLFSNREPEDQGGDVGRDIFNLKPTREEQLAATGGVKTRKLAETATIHTTQGDITIELYGRECPKTIENFVTHCRDGYFTGVIFHRVIKGFMIQTGDPEGDGTGGESIWEKEFEDEFHKDLRHDRPYTVSMANAGPNTNGSQFFITLVPTPWLDQKHTVFGRVTRGMETCQEIGSCKVDKDTDKPFDDIKIINVSLR